MKPNRVMHIYGSTVLHSMVCPECGIVAFIVRGRMSCCRVPVIKDRPDSVKFELDMVGAIRRRPSKREQDRILAEQENACFYCGISFEDTIVYRRGKVQANPIHWDHIIPFVFNGNNDGFVASCSLCNLRKTDKIFDDLTEAKEYLRHRYHEDQKAKTHRALR